MTLYFNFQLRAVWCWLFGLFLTTLSSTAFAQTTILSLDASRFQYKSTGAAYGIGWELPTNGYIEHSLSFPYTGSYQFQVQAFGTYAGSAWPQMEIRIDQQVLTSIQVSSSTAKTYSVSLNVPSGAHKIELAFVNDYYAKGKDRNLYINHLNILSQTIATTTTSTTTTTTVPATTVTWTRCATEGGVCSFSGTRQVRYGVNGSYAYQTATSTINCDNTTFGDPAVGYDKYCDYSSVVQTTTSTTLATTTTTTVPPSTSTSGIVGPTTSVFKASGPITLVSGQTVTGLAISNPNGPCIKGDGASNVHIFNNKIGPCGTTLDDSAIVIYNAHDVLIEHNAIDDIVTAFFAYNSTNNIVFDHNYVTRIRGVFPRGSMVQFHAVNGSGNRISCNVSDQPTPGYLNGPEDQVNMYVSNGTAASPIRIAYNKIRGGGPSNSGGGINLGDNGSSYVTAEGNILVNPGQYGVAIPGGHDNKMINNKVYSQQLPWSNVGMFIWNQYTPACYNSVVTGNRVNWTNKDGLNNLGTNWWDSGNCGPTSNSNNIWGDLTIGPEIWNEVIPACQ